MSAWCLTHTHARTYVRINYTYRVCDFLAVCFHRENNDNKKKKTPAVLHCSMIQRNSAQRVREMKTEAAGGPELIPEEFD